MIKSFIKFLFLLILKFCFWLLDLIIPKNNHTAVFASKSGKLLNANTYLCWLKLKNNKLFKAYLVTNNENSSDKLNIFSLKGLWRVLRSKYVFLTHGPGDILYARYSFRKVVIYIGHGTPIKTFIYTNPNFTFKEKLLSKLEVSTYSYIVASSETEKMTLTKCFNKSVDEVIITGAPRNDLLFKVQRNIKKEYGFDKIVLYAPTFRDNGSFEYFPFNDFEPKKLGNFLHQNNIGLFLRSHVNSKESQKIKNIQNVIFFGQDSEPEIQNVLGCFDALITDYSSIFIDYLLLNRPIFYIPYDIEVYKINRGLLYNYSEVQAGESISSFAQMISCFNDLILEKDNYSKMRNDIKRRFHKYESNFTERLLEAVLPK